MLLHHLDPVLESNVVEDRGDQRLLGREVLEDESLADARAPRQFPSRGPVEAMLGEDFHGRGQDLGTAVRGVEPPLGIEGAVRLSLGTHVYEYVLTYYPCQARRRPFSRAGPPSPSIGSAKPWSTFAAGIYAIRRSKHRMELAHQVRPWSRSTDADPLRTALLNAALATIYFTAAKLGLALAVVHASASAVWPPTGIALTAFLLFGNRIWLGIAVGAFLVNVTTAGTPATSLGIAVGNTLEGFIGAWLVRRYAGGRETLRRSVDIFRFALLAAGVSTVVSATIGVTTLSLAGLAPWNDFGSIWTTWWLGDAMGALVVAPALLLWGTGGPIHRPRRP